MGVSNSGYLAVQRLPTMLVSRLGGDPTDFADGAVTGLLAGDLKVVDRSRRKVSTFTKAFNKFKMSIL